MIMTPSVDIRTGDSLKLLRTLPADSVHCVVTSPPYYGLRDYGTPVVNWPPVSYSPMPGLPPVKVKRQTCSLGLEADPFSFIGHLVMIFREIHRVLHPAGTVWVNMGDSYAGSWGAQGRSGGNNDGKHAYNKSISERTLSARQIAAHPRKGAKTGPTHHGLKPKDLIGIPWRLAYALQADRWYLRQDIVWSKPNPMPESTKDRCTKAHEAIFLLTKSRRYHFDAGAIAEPASDAMLQQVRDGYDGHATKLFEIAGAQNGSEVKARIIEGARKKLLDSTPRHNRYGETCDQSSLQEAARGLGANKRSVWAVSTQPFKGAHFATFPEDLVKPCILAGCPADGVVLDPFAGSGTTGKVALELGRSAILLELNPDYAAIARKRCHVTPGFSFMEGGEA